MQNKKGFTLIEVLLVIVIIAILAAIVLVAVNPAKQIADSNNAQRRSDVNAILNASWQYALDNQGSTEGLSTSGALPDDMWIGFDESIIASDDTTASLADLCAAMTPDYLAEMPVDPTAGSFTSCDDYDTGYMIYQDWDGRIHVSAPNAENGATISITR